MKEPALARKDAVSADGFMPSSGFPRRFKLVG